MATDHMDSRDWRRLERSRSHKRIWRAAAVLVVDAICRARGDAEAIAWALRANAIRCDAHARRHGSRAWREAATSYRLAALLIERMRGRGPEYRRPIMPSRRLFAAGRLGPVCRMRRDPLSPGRARWSRDGCGVELCERCGPAGRTDTRWPIAPDRALAAYLDTSGPRWPDGLRGFVRPRPLTGDHAVLILADTPEVRALLAGAGIGIEDAARSEAA